VSQGVGGFKDSLNLSITNQAGEGMGFFSKIQAAHFLLLLLGCYLPLLRLGD
jgi:hypothetical protein